MSQLHTSKEKKQIKEIKDTLKEHATSISSMRSSLSDFNRGINSTKKLVGNSVQTENKSTKLVKVGTMLLAFPDPTPATYVAGATLIAAGVIKKKTEQPPLCEISRTLSVEIKNFEKFKRELASLRI